ncbi:putative amino-acid metabolite efflux pump [Hyphomicrobiales bacterium]|nr:putative amino-acid metabolite efflux pump [Hyphomicrobiales bacterium]CAH1698243.1 putative amino-acid metabolite efflux pump [Hyphomicrobiales bacterium]CAI0347887.1 putative amino-acid metabolite efflux pump [Hyphomicrobiales bacterium]
MHSPLPTSLSLRDALLTLAVMVVWGTNFVVIHIGVEHFPPPLFACLRFTFALLPAVFFLKRPAVPWRKLAAYGVLIGAGQFGLLFFAIKGLITPGLASLVVQSQPFFTILLAAAITHERVQPFQITGLLLAAVGIGVILWHTDGATTPLGIALVLGAALCWAAGNIVSRSTPGVDMLAYVVWTSLFAVPPLFALSWLAEGWPAIREALSSAPPAAWAAALWQAVGNVMFGYAVWGWLLSRYAAATVAPTALLVPIFGMGAAALWLGEPLPAWKFLAAGLVMSGLCINILWPRFAAIRAARHPPAS